MAEAIRNSRSPLHKAVIEMSEYNVKNYQEQGGARWVVGGEIDIISANG